MTVHELAVKVRGVIDDKVKIVFKDLPSDDPRRRQPDITKVRPPCYPISSPAPLPLTGPARVSRRGSISGGSPK